MAILIGSIVTINSPDSGLDGFQGKIVGILNQPNEDGSTHYVNFPCTYDYMWGCVWDKDNRVAFPINDLTENEDWTPENKANMHFGKSMWHTVKVFKKPFNPETTCMVEKCPKKAFRRIIFNVQGIVWEADVCREDAEKYHGCCIDNFPCKDYNVWKIENTDLSRLKSPCCQAKISNKLTNNNWTVNCSKCQKPVIQINQQTRILEWLDGKRYGTTEKYRPVTEDDYEPITA